MITQHPDFKNFIDRGCRAYYGKTIEEIEQEKKKIEQEKKHLAEKSVLSLYQKAKLNVTDIAQTLDLSVEFVTQILQKNNMV